MIEFQYFEGCPNSTKTLENLKELVKEKTIEEKEIKIVEIKDLRSAERFKFQGSPSILINGIDIYTEKVPDSFSFTCRIYNIEGKKTGILSKEYIEQKIKKIKSTVE